MTDGHYKSGEIYLKCAAQLASFYLHSDEKIVKFTKRPPTESIISNQVQQAKIQGKYELYELWAYRLWATIVNIHSYFYVPIIDGLVFDTKCYYYKVYNCHVWKNAYSVFTTSVLHVMPPLLPQIQLWIFLIALLQF